MMEKIQKILDRVESRISLWTFLNASGVLGVGGVSGWLAATTSWLDTWGAIAWWFAALIGAVATLILFLGAAWLRYAWIRGTALEKWKRQVNSVNPLDTEFNKQQA
ncbi:MAG: hypothetical protein U1E38_03360 [Rhodospirillales bacterium]